MKISIVVATCTNRVIGSNGTIPWHLPADLKHFKRLTVGHHVLMGRKTYQSIERVLGGPLPDRVNIVVTKSGLNFPDGVKVFPSVSEAVHFAMIAHEEELMVIGGGQIYSWAIAVADTIYLTQIHRRFMGDTYFPPMGVSWRQVAKEAYAADEKNRYPYTFLTYQRNPP